VYIDRLPLFVHQASCFIMFVIELGFPLLVLGTRRARVVAAVGIIALQVGLALAGNYAYFNLLVAVMCIPLLQRTSKRLMLPPSPRFTLLGTAALLGVVALSALNFADQYGVEYPAWATRVVERAESFRAVSSYGVFRVMTKTRPEIIIEGSSDRVTWTSYEFKWKPGKLDARPKFVAPWQPRLDWQMWFTAMRPCGGDPWFLQFLRRLLMGQPEVLALLQESPSRRPMYLRTTRWQYHFAPSDRAAWWVRKDPEQYCPDVMLNSNQQLLRAP
jgi:hypothetical protein